MVRIPFPSGSYKAGDVVHLDPRAFPAMVIISKEEADKIASQSPTRTFVVTSTSGKTAR